MNLDADEKGILDSFERGEWKSVGASKPEQKRYANYAEATFRKDQRVNIRLSRKDLEAIQTLALEEGLPYQTLISSLIHKYAAGRLVESSIIAPDLTLLRATKVDRQRIVDEQLRFAIAHRRLIELTYYGVVRLAEPHEYGIRRNTATLLIYQLGPAGRAKGKRLPNWRLLDISKIEALKVLDDVFSGNRDESSSELVIENEMSVAARV